MMMGGCAPFSQARENKKSAVGTWSHSASSRVEPSNMNVRLCHCGRRATLHTSRTQKNLDRALYVCSLSKVLLYRVWHFVVRESGSLCSIFYNFVSHPLFHTGIEIDKLAWINCMMML